MFKFSVQNPQTDCFFREYDAEPPPSRAWSGSNARRAEAEAVLFERNESF